MILASFISKIALGAALLGGTAGVIGALAVLRKRSLMGDVLAHASLPGICLAYLLFDTRNLPVLSAGALVTGLVAVATIAAVTRWTRTREDAAMALALSTFFGGGLVLLTVIQQQARGNQAGLATYMFGEIAALRSRDVTLIAVVGVLLLLGVMLFYKEIKTLCFDRDFAQTQGWPTFVMDIAMMAAVAVVTVIGLPICGVVLMAAMLIVPCVAARYWSHRLGVVMILSGLIGAASALGGVLAAAPVEVTGLAILRPVTQGMPPGPLIVVTGALVFLVSALFAPERGVVSRLWRVGLLRLRIATDHLLRRLFELGEHALPQRREAPLASLTDRMHTTWLARWLVVALAQWRGLVERPSTDSIRLTPEGLAAAARLVRTHRLWERFLVEHAHIAADHVDRSADDIEHVLPDELVDSLEDQLREEGRLPQISDEVPVPTSPHRIDA